MKRYLVPYEGSTLSKAALKYAIQFANCINGHIDICYIADERALANPVFDLTVLALQAVGTLGDLISREKAKLELKTKLVARGEDLLEELENWPELNPVGQLPFEYSTRVEVASPPVYLTKASDGYDVIFMGLWGEMRAYKEGLWGGTSEVLIRKGKCNILLATNEYRAFRHLIVGYDNRPRSRQALAWAGMIGESMGIPVSIIVCGQETESVEDKLDKSREIAPSYDTEFRYLSSRQHPADGILSLAKENPDSLICMGAFGDQPIREFFLGSIAEEVLRRSESPVILFK